MTTEHPILFSAPMVRAILEGRKTQTRRVWKQPKSLVLKGDYLYEDEHTAKDGYIPITRDEVICPYGHPGDRLWVREEHYRFGHWEPVPGVRTKSGRQKWKFIADTDEILYQAPPEYRKGRHHKDSATPAWHKRLGRFMPRKASRINLLIKNIHVERLQDISESDARLEGLVPRTVDNRTGGMSVKWALQEKWDDADKRGIAPADVSFFNAKNAFGNLWISINGAENWASNPWVWVIEFERIIK